MQEASFSQSVALMTMIFLAVYYVVANVFCFYAYREFKGIMVDVQTGGGVPSRAESEDNNRFGGAAR